MSMEQNIEVFKSSAEGLVITTPEDRTAAEGMLAALRGHKKTWLAAVEDSVKKAHASWKAAVAHRDSIAVPLDGAERTLKTRIAEYDRNVREAAERERARLQAIADAAAEAERRRLFAQAEKLKTPELKQQRMEEAEMINAPVVAVVAAIPETKLATVTTYGFEIVDVTLIPADYMIPDEKKIGQVVRATKGTLAIPGVKINKSTTVR